MAKTSEYYKKNPKARKKRLTQQKKYNKTPKGLAIRGTANKLNKLLPTVDPSLVKRKVYGKQNF